MSAMVMRHLQRVLRLPSSTAVSSAHYRAMLCGSDLVELPSRVHKSASLPAAVHEFARRSSSSAYPSPMNIPFGERNHTSDVHEYNRLISALNHKRRPDLARDLYDDMLLDGVKPTQDTFYLLIAGCVKGSRLQDVMFFFEEMKAIGLTPDVVLYNCVIAACGRSLQLDRAFQVAEEMEASGIPPRHQTYLVLLRSCALAGRVDEGYGVVRRMAASGLILDKQFYSALIMAHKNRKPYSEETVEKIFALLEQSKQSSTHDLMAVAATGELEVDDDIERGLLNFWSEDLQSKQGLTNRHLSVYRAAVAALSSLGNKQAVQDVLQVMKQDGHEPDTYCTIQLIKCCLAEGDFEQACTEYNKFLEAGRQPTLDLYIILIEGALLHCSPTSSAVAQKLLVDMGQKRFFLNGLIGTQLLQRACQGNTKDLAVANLVWDMMKNREVKISKPVALDYFRALERSNVAKDDPRLVAVKSLIGNDRGLTFAHIQNMQHLWSGM